MKINEVRNMTFDELKRKEQDLKEELFNLRFRLAAGQLDNPMVIKGVKKDIAKVKTIIREKEIQEAQ